MAVTVRSIARDSRPERLQVTQDLERRFKEQEQAKEATKVQASHSIKSEKATQGQR